MSIIYAVPFRMRHLKRIADNLRSADSREASALDGRPPLFHLLQSVEATRDPLTVMCGSVPCGLFGVHEETPDIGNPWLVGTDLMVCNWATFARESRVWTRDMFWRYSLLRNLVHERNTVHVRWLEWLGFTMGERVQMPTGEWFRLFYHV